MFKKTIFALSVLCLSVGANAQVTNEEKTSTQNVEKQILTSAGLGYYSFDGFDNYGFVVQGTKMNGIGIDMALRANFEDHGNYNVDFGINYTFGLYQKNDLDLFLTLAAGPSFRTQDQYDGLDKHGNIKYKEKFMVDAFLNGRLGVRYKKFILSGGYFFWAPKFKFGKDYKADGFNVSLSYCF